MKVLRLMPDHCSSGLWNEEGVNLDYNLLGRKYDIDYNLFVSIGRWQGWYDRENGFCDEFGNDAAGDYERFAEWGQTLAVELRAHMKQYGVEVVYAV